ncbi:hypothetical protein D3C75_945160 [compost metagenome]
MVGIQVRCSRLVERGKFILQVIGQPHIIVVDHLACGHIDYSRYGRPAGIIGISLVIGLAQELDAQHRVLAAFIEDEFPAQILLMLAPSHQINADGVLQTQQLPHDGGTVGPVAALGPDQPVAPRFYGKLALPFSEGSGEAVLLPDKKSPFVNLLLDFLGSYPYIGCCGHSVSLPCGVFQKLRSGPLGRSR